MKSTRALCERVFFLNIYKDKETSTEKNTETSTKKAMSVKIERLPSTELSLGCLSNCRRQNHLDFVDDSVSKGSELAGTAEPRPQALTLS